MTSASFDPSATSFETESPLILVLLGPPGAGKGTHAIPLSRTLGIPHISTGDLFRGAIRGETALGKRAKGYIDEGRLVPDTLVIEMLFDRISQSDCRKGYILDGFPRTISQANAFQEKIKLDRFLAINFEVADDLLVERILGRLACKGCGQPHHKTYDPPKISNDCNNCGSPLYSRDDDKEEILRERLNVYRIQTAPLIEFYEKLGRLETIAADKRKEAVLEDLYSILQISPSLV